MGKEKGDRTLDKEVREIIEFISKSEFVEFELQKKDGWKIKLVKARGQNTLVAAPLTVAHAAVAPVANPAPVAPTAAPPVDSGLHEIRSPLVGTFYRAPSPEAPNFTEVGQVVKKGQALCIIEAMKLMNEIESDADGVVEEVVVQNNQPVEYGEILFRIRPGGSSQ